MSEELPTNDNDASKWDVLKPENASREVSAEDIKAFIERDTAEAPERASDIYKEILSSERYFANRNKKLAAKGETMTKKEFEVWEDDMAFSLKSAQRELRKTDYSVETIAECERHMIYSPNDSDLHETIEAQAGRFFHERLSALREAINASDDENADEDLKYAIDFYSSVMDHLDFKYMTREEQMNYYGDYEDGRTRAHNNAIRHLNGLNRLAKKYDVRPFTVRDFITSDIRDKKNQTDAVRRMMRYDRDIVEEYYALAFSSEIQKREYQLKRNMEYGIY